MVETVLRTEDLPPADRFDCWYQLTRSSIIPSIIRADQITDFRASARVLDFAAVQVHLLSEPKVQVRRPWKLVRQSDHEHFHLTFVERGEVWFAQAGRCATVRMGGLLFYDSSHPFEAWAAHDESCCTSSRHFGIRVPRAMLPRPVLADQLIGTGLPNHTGMRTLLAGYLRELIKPSARFSAADATTLGGIAVDLVAALLAHETDTVSSLEAETRQRALLARIHHFIRQHLGDPSLSPATIAAAHHISVRYLHKLFQTQDVTVAALIRRYRLERCQLDLADARQLSRPIHTIAARWGFTDNAHFSRLFRATYGISARDYRAGQQHDVRASSTPVPASSTTS